MCLFFWTHLKHKLNIVTIGIIHAAKQSLQALCSHVGRIFFSQTVLFFPNTDHVLLECWNWSRSCMFILWECFVRISCMAWRKLLLLITLFSSPFNTAGCYFYWQIHVNLPKRLASLFWILHFLFLLLVTCMLHTVLD